MLILFSGLLWLLRFAMGACVFSFFGVVAVRLPARESALHGRSRCAACGKTLSARELIPCLSFLLQRGRCRGCGARIPAICFWMEAAGGLLFVGCGACFGYGAAGLLSLRGLLCFCYLGILTMVALMDWETRVIYDRFPIAVLLLGAFALWLFPEHGLSDRLIGAAVVAGPMLLLALLIEGAFGGGDIKLMAASGFLLGWRAALAAAFLAVLGGGVYCAVMLAQKKLRRDSAFAFGPFLAFGLAVALFWGDRLACLYASFF